MQRAWLSEEGDQQLMRGFHKVVSTELVKGLST